MKKVKLNPLNIVLIVILIPVVFFCSVIFVNSLIKPDEVPSFFGWKPFIVLTGSMETQIFAGDVAVVKEVDIDVIKENDIIAFKQNDIVTTHRVVEIIEESGKKKFITKGDNNNTLDDGYVLEDGIEGKYQFDIPKLGTVLMFIQKPSGFIICIFTILTFGLIYILIRNQKINKLSPEEIELLEKIRKEKKKN